MTGTQGKKTAAPAEVVVAPGSESAACRHRCRQSCPRRPGYYLCLAGDEKEAVMQRDACSLRCCSSSSPSSQHLLPFGSCSWQPTHEAAVYSTGAGRAWPAAEGWDAEVDGARPALLFIGGRGWADAGGDEVVNLWELRITARELSVRGQTRSIQKRLGRSGLRGRWSSSSKIEKTILEKEEYEERRCCLHERWDLVVSFTLAADERCAGDHPVFVSRRSCSPCSRTAEADMGLHP